MLSTFSFCKRICPTMCLCSIAYKPLKKHKLRSSSPSSTKLHLFSSKVLFELFLRAEPVAMGRSTKVQILPKFHVQRLAAQRPFLLPKPRFSDGTPFSYPGTCQTATPQNRLPQNPPNNRPDLILSKIKIQRTKFHNSDSPIRTLRIPPS